MLLTKAFKISDDLAINELLTKYRLASGAHILISDGQVLIPYEDGAPPNAAQTIVQIREDQNKLRQQMEIVVHSNRVLSHLVADAQDRVNVAAAEEDKAVNKEKNELKQKLKEAISARDQLLNQVMMNEHDINRFQVNIDEYEAAITKIIESQGIISG